MIKTKNITKKTTKTRMGKGVTSRKEKMQKLNTSSS
jgi:hypothetical protein